MMYDFVIWDFDGTLFDTYPIITRVFLQALEKRGIHESYAAINGAVRVSFGELFRYLSAYDLGEEFRLEVEAERRAAEKKLALPFKGAYGLRADIVSAGGRNVLFTHRDKTAFEMLRDFGMDTLFCDAVLDGDGFPAKPAPDAVNALISRCTVDRSHAIMVGDREIDIGSGINAGIDSCLCLALEHNNTAAKYKARDFSEIRKIIFGS